MSNQDTTEITLRGWTRVQRNSLGVITSSTSGSSAGTLNILKIVGVSPRRKPVGWLFPTDYYRKHVRFNYPHGWCEAIGPGGSIRQDGALTGSSAAAYLGFEDFRVTTDDGINNVDVDMLSQAESKALNGLLTHGKDRESTWRPGIAWGERRETAELLNSTGRRVINLFKALKKGDWKAANGYLPTGSRKRWNDLKNTPYGEWLTARRKGAVKATPKALASGLLEYQNGWKPFLGDLHNAAEALANRNQLADWVITGIGKYNKTVGDVVSKKFNTANPKSPHTLWEWEKILAVKVRLDATVSDQHLHKLAQLGMNNPAADVWELLPLSYIWDYFHGMGEWLQSLGAPDGLTFYSGSKTVFYDFVCSNSSADPSTGKWAGLGRHLEFRRVPYTGFPIPIAPLSLKPQPLKNSQLANMLAVGYSLFSGLGVPYARMA